MKKHWLPIVATGLALSFYSCNKHSASGPAEPQPTAVASNAEAQETKVAPEEFTKDFEQYLEIAEGGELDIVVHRVESGDYVVQYVKPDGHPAARTQICIGSQGMSLGYCIASYINGHPEGSVTIDNCGDTNPKTHCAWVP